MVHKLFAVPESVYRMSRPSDSDGMQSVLADLERQMIVINQNRSLSQEERFLRYNQIWIRYQDIRKRLAEKPMHVTLDDATLDKMRAMANASPPPPPPFDNLNRIDRFLRPIPPEPPAFQPGFQPQAFQPGFQPPAFQPPAFQQQDDGDSEDEGGGVLHTPDGRTLRSGRFTPASSSRQPYIKPGSPAALAASLRPQPPPAPKKAIATKSFQRGKGHSDKFTVRIWK
jgi:hypothetical protein